MEWSLESGSYSMEWGGVDFLGSLWVGLWYGVVPCWIFMEFDSASIAFYGVRVTWSLGISWVPGNPYGVDCLTPDGAMDWSDTIDLESWVGVDSRSRVHGARGLESQARKSTPLHTICTLSTTKADLK